ncbi:hypothetical protein [Nocardioides sp. CFH 31398]|uniref:hypothetical protein n=1 Tax=Nocardioides sp. CFH 31398 TaxID=2919579 RepID=UPI001F06C493|nr:hypothetical protein [Nocardioides sp. CFH 31398]MCH1868039.1 hypothetical protein [Nocardioides sp. CFH 31398]
MEGARAGRAGVLVLVLLLLSGIAVGTWFAVGRLLGPIIPGLPTAEGCSVEVDGHYVEVSAEQAENAALISAIAVRRGLPARAASIALATAYQESKIINIDYGDRDSLGLFQQRPSQGWGTEEQVQDPVYATNAFYDALVEVDGYEDMRVTVAAQEVQRSGFPEAYADHEADARALASALTGNSPGTFTCTVDGEAEASSTDLNDVGLTERADAVRRDVLEAYGEVQTGGFAPEGVDSGHMEGSAHYDGRAVDFFFRPVNDTNQVRGWSVAQYLVAQAERLDVATVIYDGRIWTARRSAQGWREYDVDTDGRDPATAAILEHRDHVHVDVFE